MLHACIHNYPAPRPQRGKVLNYDIFFVHFTSGLGMALGWVVELELLHYPWATVCLRD